MTETKQIDEKTHGKIILALSLPLLVFLIIASYFGIFITETYAELTVSFTAQGIGQDIVNLFIISPFYSYHPSSIIRETENVCLSGAVF